jgi:hypothetical protein
MKNLVINVKRLILSNIEIRGEVEPGVTILEYFDVDENLVTGLFFMFLSQGCQEHLFQNQQI